MIPPAASILVFAGILNATALLNAALIPAGTPVQIRLLTPVSAAAAKPNDVIKAVVIIPVVIDNVVSLPAGVNLTGKVISALAASDTGQAELELRFTSAGKVPFNATVTNIENARESVDAEGKITGISGSETFSSRIDQGIAKLSNSGRFGALAGLIQGAKQTLKIEEADPNISFDAGTELTVKLTNPVSWTGADTSPFAHLKAIDPPAALVDLVDRQPFRTFSESPRRPSDLTNLMLLGTAEQVRQAFEKAGWTTAARLSTQSKLETARAIIESRGYKEGPVSVLYLDENPPDFVFQKGNNTFAQRHHIRIFRRPQTFAGQQVWVCSSTHDTGIAFSEADATFVHKIDSNIDLERAKVVSDLIFTGFVRAIALVGRPEIPQSATNATGDSLITDGKMAVLQLTP